MAVFPIVREIEAERLALAIQSDLGTLETIQANTSSVKEIAAASEIVTDAAANALREDDDQIHNARNVAVQARLIADQLLILRNFAGGAALFARRALGPSAKQVGIELGELGMKSWEEIKDNLPAGVGIASRALPVVALIGLLAAISPPVAGIAGAAAAFRPLSRALKQILGSANSSTRERAPADAKAKSAKKGRGRK
ncbi:hypothetical protein [Bradyrhizobium sp. CCBAU 53415]|uniref:hypothetical protein n=1 Tax=Bradyrhizobium sp. CCBAU 53415 TaxID=1325119 RepID=UPI0023051EAD|nr:hypothetical protein [Bradyrhizobium sp. CCBAU 53415]